MNQQVDRYPLVCSQRLTLAAMAFAGSIFVYSARVNLSVAILCMVRSDVPSNFTSPGQLALNDTTQVVSVDDGCGGDISDGDATKTSNIKGEFDWDKPMQSRLLAMYFYGYIFTQIPCGWLASRFGGRQVWGLFMLISSFSTLLTPVAARTHIYFACALRFLLGFAAGVTFPCVHALLGQWAPPFERSKMASWSFGGVFIGLIATFSISGYLCVYGFDNGWASIFYLCGIFNLVWVVAWFLLTADSPDQHKRISPKEKAYIRYTIGKGVVDKKVSVPWGKMFKSGPLWGIIIAHSFNNYSGYTLLTALPTFMKEALKFDIKQNGVVSAIPYIVNFVGSLLSGVLADMINERGWLSVKNQRKLFQTVSFLGCGGCLCLVVQMDCSQRYIAVALLCLALAFISLNRGAYLVNHLDLAPGYAGVLFGITNTLATIPGMIAPIIAGALTPNRTPEEWRNVFYLCAAVGVAGSIFYLVLADGELQDWSKYKGYDVTVDVKEEDGNTIELEIKDSDGAGNHLI